mmetsp:Transcript_84179/g.272108  ORF Transcript_84179/g.272108 Transcript_84179/m.272108 type:complete len:382 (+) Transcript_84179:113-1258(+)|eukprot:CAMPEP_0203861316 /NCGR_PEP_ID=MMETSP0359-20131031/12935_1 /ASSEMBLY_ACC=CAM_ASM_000338 /TAXON_ID=268821 /ORGANISM="Scrippsiella Hangoei, Strain SHTV-5" /LENGTH=381 /DNA_ID=CAMNT_0050778521 /DNA_START=113 /DNA_END=1258 /DNA_ORIENTATION=+
MNFYVITGGYVVAGGLAVGIFLYGKSDGNSFFDKAYRIFCVHCPRLLKKGLTKCCGKRAPAALDAAWDYVCYKNNPIVQLFYLLVVGGGYLTFVAFGYPHIPNPYLHRAHKYIGFVIYLMCVSVWWKACSADPGIVTASNVEDLCEVYEWDEQIFTSQKCNTCNLLKPARSKHCSLCNVCLAKFDHHCIWINNCVGVANHKWFLLFLFWHLVICAYGSGLGATIAYHIIQEKDLFRAVFVDPVSRERKQATWMIVIQYMLATEGMVVFVTILCAVMGLVLFGFFMWHLNLVRIGTTTNELSKWNYLKWCTKQEEDGQEKVKGLQNIYNKGILKNFREVFIPINVHKLPRQFAAEKEKKNGQKVESVPPRKAAKGKDKIKKG